MTASAFHSIRRVGPRLAKLRLECVVSVILNMYILTAVESD
jgi:hypothetical protein